MQRTTIYIFMLLTAGWAFMSCEREDFNETIDIPGEVTPTEVEIAQGFALMAQDEAVFISDGSAKRLVGGGNTLFAISSGTIICEGGSSYSTSYDGENFFALEFIEVAGEYFVFRAGLTTEVDAQLMTLFSLVPPGSGCQEQLAEVTITSLTEDQISGSFTGDFFKMDGPLGNDLPCGGFVYVGEYTASFSLAYEDCE